MDRYLLIGLAIAMLTGGCSSPPVARTPSSAPQATLAVEASPTSRRESSPTQQPALEMPGAGDLSVREYPVPMGAHPHDVAPADDGRIWYTAQQQGALGWLDPETGETRHIELGSGSSPHGVIVGPDGAPWVTDGGLNSIVRVDPETEAVERFSLPADVGYANLNTATFDGRGILWFTGQSGVFGRLHPATGDLQVFEAPRGRGPYGIATAPDGSVYYASLAGSYIARVDPQSDQAVVLEPPTSEQGARRIWSDSDGRLWFSEWNAGQLGRYDPEMVAWMEWPLPGDSPRPYALYVDEWDAVWMSDFGANAILRFRPASKAFDVFSLPSSGAEVRQMLGRPGEIWGAESGVDKLVVIRPQ